MFFFIGRNKPAEKYTNWSIVDKRETVDVIELGTLSPYQFKKAEFIMPGNFIWHRTELQNCKNCHFE